jgi:hypothetical protein
MKLNKEQAKGMRVFLGKRYELKKVLQVADTCTSKINSSNGDFGFPQKAVLLVYQNFIGCM